MNKWSSAGAVIFRRDEKGHHQFLVVQHAKRSETEKEYWALTKGTLESGETLGQAAKREINEEVGLEVEFIEGFEAVISYNPESHIHKTVTYFLADAYGQEVQVDGVEIVNYQWLDLDSAIEKLTYENVRQVLKEANQFLKEE